MCGTRGKMLATGQRETEWFGAPRFGGHMNLMIPSSTKALGFWSAVLATLLSLFFDVSQPAEWFGLMGSGGGPENA
jgi:hypothetical protein